MNTDLSDVYYAKTCIVTCCVTCFPRDKMMTCLLICLQIPAKPVSALFCFLLSDQRHTWRKSCIWYPASQIRAWLIVTVSMFTLFVITLQRDQRRAWRRSWIWWWRASRVNACQTVPRRGYTNPNSATRRTASMKKSHVVSNGSRSTTDSLTEL